MPNQNLSDIFYIPTAYNSIIEEQIYSQILSDLASTPEGEFLYSLYGDPFNHGGTNNDEPFWITSILNIGNHFDPQNGNFGIGDLPVINIDWDQIKSLDYEQKYSRGNISDFSIERVLIHELTHALFAIGIIMTELSEIRSNPPSPVVTLLSR